MGKRHYTIDRSPSGLGHDGREKRKATFGPSQEGLGENLAIIDSAVNDLRPEEEHRPDLDTEIT